MYEFDFYLERSVFLNEAGSQAVLGCCDGHFTPECHGSTGVAIAMYNNETYSLLNMTMAVHGASNSTNRHVLQTNNQTYVPLRALVMWL